MNYNFNSSTPGSQGVRGQVKQHSAALTTCAIPEDSDCNFDPGQWGVALTYHGYFNPGGTDTLAMGRVIHTHGQDMGTKEEVRGNPTAIKRNKLNSRSYLDLRPDNRSG